MKRPEDGKAVEAAGIARRRLLKLAAYSLPAMTLLNVTGMARAQGHSALCCYDIAAAQPGTSGVWYIYECVNGQPGKPVCQPAPNTCYYITQNPLGGMLPPCAWVIVPCGQGMQGCSLSEGFYAGAPCPSVQGCWTLRECSC